MNKLSSSDRKALIKLASALPKGSPERKTILAAVTFKGVTPMTLRGGPPSNDVVEVRMSGDMGGPRFNPFKMKAGDLQSLNNVLEAVWEYSGTQAGDPNLFEEAEELEQNISKMQDELSQIKQKVFPIINAIQKLRIPLSMSDLKKLNGDSILFDIVDSSGRKWVLDGGEDWTLDE